MNEPQPAEDVRIEISEDLVRLALGVADLLKELPPNELLKAKTVYTTAKGKPRPTAKNVKELFALVGFNFAMHLRDAREARQKEPTDVRHDTTTN